MDRYSLFICPRLTSFQVRFLDPVQQRLRKQTDHEEVDCLQAFWRHQSREHVLQYITLISTCMELCCVKLYTPKSSSSASNDSATDSEFNWYCSSSILSLSTCCSKAVYHKKDALKNVHAALFHINASGQIVTSDYKALKRKISQRSSHKTIVWQTDMEYRVQVVCTSFTILLIHFMKKNSINIFGVPPRKENHMGLERVNDVNISICGWTIASTTEGKYLCTWNNSF